jgi:hypothetical protein
MSCFFEKDARIGVASVVARVSSRRSSSAIIVVAIVGARENENSREGGENKTFRDENAR